MNAAAKDGWPGTAELFFWTGVKTVYTVPDILTPDLIFRHDDLRDRYDRGEISGLDYMEGSGWAGAESLTKGLVMYATGGLAGAATKGLGLTAQFMSAGAAAGVSCQATDDVFRGERSGAGTYLGMGGGGALLGLFFRGGLALRNSEIGNMPLGQGWQLLRGKFGNRAITTEALSRKVAYAEELIALESREAINAARTRAARRAYLNKKFRNNANINIDETISWGTGYYKGLNASKSTERFITIKRFATRNRPETLMPNIYRANKFIQARTWLMMRSKTYREWRAHRHMRGYTENSPFVSAVRDVKALSESLDDWASAIATGCPGMRNVRRAPDIGTFKIPESRLILPRKSNIMSIDETEVVFWGHDLKNFLIRWEANPFK